VSTRVKLALVDFLDEKRVATADGTGLAEIQFQVPTGEYWLVDRAAIRTDSAAASTLLVFGGGPSPNDEDLLDGSTSGNLDVADNSSPWRIFPGQHLTLRWTGMTAASLAKAHLQGRKLARVP